MVDAGSQVSTISESLYNKYLCNQPLEHTFSITLTAVNGLQLPYVGYTVTTLEICDTVIENIDILVVKENSCSHADRPGIIGMNILCHVVGFQNSLFQPVKSDNPPSQGLSGRMRVVQQAVQHRPFHG